jgi:hypothetical protein
MSNIVNPNVDLKTAIPKCLETDVKQSYDMLRGPQSRSFQIYPANSYSNSNFTVTAPTPSSEVGVGKQWNVRMTVTSTITGSVAAGGYLYQAGTIAPRAYPLNSNIQNVSLTLNNQTFTSDNANWFSYITRYLGKESSTKLNSTTPTYLDNCTEYSTLNNTIANPLGGYGDVPDAACMQPRGSFTYQITGQTGNTGAGGSQSFTISTTIEEPIFCPPLNFEENSLDELAFYHLSTFSLQVTWSTLLDRFWSFNTGTNNVTISSVTTTLGQPSLYIQYFTRPLLLTNQIQAPVLSYNCPILYWTSTSTNQTVSSLSSAQLSTNAINLQSVPSKVFIWVSEPISNKSISSTDVPSFRIDSLSVNFNNQQGLLASAVSQDLYKISVANGLEDSWLKWYGLVNPYSSGTYQQIGSVGSVACLRFGTDITILQEDVAVGLVGSYQFQISNLNCTNISAASKSAVVNLLFVYDGVMTIDLSGNVVRQQGVVSKDDVLRSSSLPRGVFYSNQLLVGGSFKSFFKGIKNAAKKGADLAREYGPKALELIKQYGPPQAQMIAEQLEEYAPAADNLAKSVGLGLKGGKMKKNVLRS